VLSLRGEVGCKALWQLGYEPRDWSKLGTGGVGVVGGKLVKKQGVEETETVWLGHDLHLEEVGDLGVGGFPQLGKLTQLNCVILRFSLTEIFPKFACSNSLDLVSLHPGPMFRFAREERTRETSYKNTVKCFFSIRRHKFGSYSFSSKDVLVPFDHSFCSFL
jgi:hypothetical protein